MRISDWVSDVCSADLKQAIGDENLTLIRIDVGSVRLVMSVRESDRAAMNIAKLREAVADSGVTLLGAVALEAVSEAEKAKEALAAASADLLASSEERRVGKECVRTCRYRGGQT